MPHLTNSAVLLNIVQKAFDPLVHCCTHLSVGMMLRLGNWVTGNPLYAAVFDQLSRSHLANFYNVFVQKVHTTETKNWSKKTNLVVTSGLKKKLPHI